MRQSNTHRAVTTARAKKLLPTWLERELVRLPISYTLCTNADICQREQERMGVKPSCMRAFVGVNGACCQFFDDDDTCEPLINPCAIVTIDGAWAVREKAGIQIAALLTHEAVHIWQRGMLGLGERYPSDEFMAYGIQSISQELMFEFAQQMGLK